MGELNFDTVVTNVCQSFSCQPSQKLVESTLCPKVSGWVSGTHASTTAMASGVCLDQLDSAKQT